MRVRVLIVATVMLLAACSRPSTPPEYVEAGRAAAAAGRSNEAALYYKQALQEDLDYIEARLELGVLYIALGDLEAAQRFLSAAVEADYQLDTAVPLLASALLQQNRVFALEQLLDEHKAAALEPATHLQLGLYEVLLYARTNRHDTGRMALTALGDAALDCELCLLTEAHLRSNDAPTDALATLDELLLRYPDNAEAHLLRGQLYFALRNPTRAFQDFEDFKRLQPLAGYAQFLLAMTALQLEDRAIAERHVNKLLAANPRQPLANHLKALLAFEHGDYALAGEHAELSMGRGLKSPANFLVAGVSAYHLARPEAALHYLRKASVAYPRNAELQRLMMLLNLQLGDLSAAQESFVSHDLRNVEDVLFGNLMAYQLVQRGRFGEAGSVLDYLENTPVRQPAIRLQTQALKAQLELGEVMAGEELSAEAEEGESTGRMVRIMILLESNAPEEAQQQAEEWLRDEPGSVDALNVQAYVFQQTDQPQLALELYERALSIDPANSPSLFYLAAQAVEQTAYRRATELYLTVLYNNPENLSALRALLGLTFATQAAPDWDQLLQPLNNAVLSDDQVVAVSDALFQWQQYSKLNAFLAEAREQSEWSDTLWMIWLKNEFYLFGVDQFLEKFDLYYQQNSLPDHVLFALSVLEQQGQWELSLTLIDRLDENTQRAQSLQLAKAVALVELQQFDEAEQLLAQWPGEGALASARWYLQGRLKGVQGDLPQSASYLSAYYDSSPGFHSVSHLADVLLEDGRTEDMAALARRHMSEHPSDDSARLALALRLAPTHSEVALELLQNERSDWQIRRSWKMSNNVAWLYLQQGLPQEALPYANNALALNPEDEQVKVTHARVLRALEGS
ncbi:tetratricopeptide repeat protein [Congregibacter brevis]|uniref:Tetratricopeptide repeat protein n=1 Tax=Congregibacter brevis TaxID=3081201 RepID=A0ABZ0IFZ6_9GAMM|nr:tetratricopeptide repeat protein [Congregibacter sp. IMCC45268]